MQKLSQWSKKVVSDRYFQIRKPDILFESFDNEVILINLENGNYYSIQNVAVEIWSLIENGFSESGIIERILGRYQDQKKEVVQSVNLFLADLLKDGLIEEIQPQHDFDKNQAGETISAAPVTDLPAFVPPILDRYTDMQELLLLDPIHEVGEKGWPIQKSDEAPQLEKPN
jgi:hypothetical protein